MKPTTLLFVAVSIALSSGCGARTGDDDLLGYGSNVGSGGLASSGGSAGSPGSGGSFSIGGGPVGVGGQPVGGGFGIGGQPNLGCCFTHDAPGCDGRLIEECVCGVDPFCCNTGWDQACVDQADARCFASCSVMGVGGMPNTGGMPSAGGAPNTGGMTGAGGSVPGGNCCQPHLGRGCQSPFVSSCVCNADPFCCTNAWDSICAAQAEFCGASCGGNGSGGAGVGGAPASGGAPMGVGGGSGGSPGAGGGSAGQCSVVFPGACGTCVCESCFPQLTSCLGDFGCLAIFSCIENTGCSGFGCYQPSTCQGIIDIFGGVTSPSTINALSLVACSAVNGCPCN